MVVLMVAIVPDRAWWKHGLVDRMQRRASYVSPAQTDPVRFPAQNRSLFGDIGPLERWDLRQKGSHGYDVALSKPWSDLRHYHAIGRTLEDDIARDSSWQLVWECANSNGASHYGTSLHHECQARTQRLSQVTALSQGQNPGGPCPLQVRVVG